MGSIPQNLDWVSARAKCSAEVIFAQLLTGVEADLELIAKVRKLEPGTGFHVECSGDATFHVFKIGKINPRVSFSRDGDTIKISDEVSNQVHTATLTINAEGRCRVVIAGEELEQWGVRKMALEALFFGQ